jgi:transcriptional regulator with XRE-family HTH domain
MPPRRKSKPRSAEHAALGEAIRRLRHERGLAQEELADRVETEFTQIGGIERGLRNPSYATLLRIAAALETRPGAIVALADRVLDEEEKGDQREAPDSAQTSSTSRSQSASTSSAQP